MSASAKLVESFEKQVNALIHLRNRLDQSIESANRQLDRLRRGETVEQVFGAPSKRHPAEPGGGSRDYR